MPRGLETDNEKMALFEGNATEKITGRTGSQPFESTGAG
jgi:hypothetical protein